MSLLIPFAAGVINRHTEMMKEDRASKAQAKADGAGSEAEAMLKSAKAVGELILKSK